MVFEVLSHVRTGISILCIDVVVARRGVDPNTSCICINQIAKNSVRVSLPAVTHIDDRAAEAERRLIVRILCLISVMFFDDGSDGVRDLDVDQVGIRGNAPGPRADNARDASRGRRRLAKKELWLADEVEGALTACRDHMCRHI